MSDTVGESWFEITYHVIEYRNMISPPLRRRGSTIGGRLCIEELHSIAGENANQLLVIFMFRLREAFGAGRGSTVLGCC